jgi:hypothetical protein
MYLQKIYSFCGRLRCDYVDLIDYRFDSVADVAWGILCAVAFIRWVSTYYKRRDKERLGNFLGEMWNTVASIANNVNVFNATWIFHSDCNAAPHYFWSLLVQLRQNKNCTY